MAATPWNEAWGEQFTGANSTPQQIALHEQDNSPMAQLAGQISFYPGIGQVILEPRNEGPEQYRGTQFAGFAQEKMRQTPDGRWYWLPEDRAELQKQTETQLMKESTSGGWGKLSGLISDYGPALVAAAFGGIAAAGAGAGAGGGFAAGSSFPAGSVAGGELAGTLGGGALGPGSLAFDPSIYSGGILNASADVAASAFPGSAAEIAAANQAAAAAIGEGVATGTSGLTVGGSAATLSPWEQFIQQIQNSPVGNLPPGTSTLAQQAFGGDSTGQTPLTGSAGGNVIDRIINGTATPGDWASVLGTAGSTALGVAGSNAQTGALQDMQNQFLSLGAPSRARLEASYAPGFSVWDDPATRDAGTRAADIAARSYSAQAGNPFGSPSAQSGIYQSVLAGVGLPQLNTYRSQNASSGQLGLNTAGTAAAGAASNAGGTYDALGYGLGRLTQQAQPDYGDMLRRFSLNLGTGLV